MCFFIKENGFFCFLKRLLIRVISRVIAVPIACGVVLVYPLVQIRLIKLFSSRIGHYSFNTEAILCALDMELENHVRRKTLFYVLPGEPLCNTQLHYMWKRTIPILPLSHVAAEVDKLLIHHGGKKYRNDSLKNIFEPSGDGRDKWDLLGRVKECHLSFTPQEEDDGRVLLKEMGIPEGAPFICLLVRDSAYLNTYMPSTDWSYHDSRDADINSYQLAASYLAEKGYYVVRMGKVVKDQFFTNNPKIIDYANSKLRTDFMDIYLSANCFFYLTTCSGLDSVARVFRKPLLVTNLVLQDFDIWHPWKIFILKKIEDVKNNRILTFEEMRKLYFEMRRKKEIPQLMKNRGLRYIDNTPEEIKDAVEEMLESLLGTWISTGEDEKLQKKFWEIFPKYLTGDNNSQFNIPVCEDIKMRAGTIFLKKNLSLLTDMEISEVTAL